MESDSDGEMEEFSGMELPPLINSLKRILSEYPDGGQIIKELIQNAEDAGATEVKLMYDDRNINQDTGNDKAYRKFFKGPALCLYNNAIFEDSDWKGIRMIDMSVKESDPLKVGKFGLGFKSVFHMTDYPCIMSGRKLLLIDPQQPNLSKVNAMMDLRKLTQYRKRMDVDALFKALDGTFGVSHGTITTGMYQGTLFWFPLRQIPSKLSSNIYDEKKTIALFKAIDSEHKSLLIFLKSLTYISLSRRTVGEGQRDIAIVEIQNAQEVKEERDTFKKKIAKLSNNPSGPAVQSTVVITVQCTKPSHQRNQRQISVCKWLVVNYFMGNNASQSFMTLIHDKAFASSPYVSVGAPLSLDTDDDTLEGHVFCFLPLPREGPSLTGLPVHVNGFFSLNTSRHHVKWLTDEQDQQQITDKDVLWNKHLITEALPVAYGIWIEKAVEVANKHENSAKFVASVHNAIPVKNDVKGKWQKLLKPLFCKLKETSFLFSYNQHKWVTKDTALFTSVTDHMSPEYDETIIKVLTQMEKHYVDIPDGQIKTLNHYLSLNRNSMLTPKLLSEFLKEDEANNYQNMSSDEKMCILQYLSKEDLCRYVQGLQLIPVASDRWETFNDGFSGKIYKCSSKQLRLFPGLEDMFLLCESKFPDNLFSVFDRMCKQGTFQLRILNDDDQSEIEMLLQNVIEAQIPGVVQKRLKMSRQLNIHWLQDVWQYITSKGIISVCQRVPLLPILKTKNWVNPDVDIVKVSDMMILAEHSKEKLPDDVCQCLRALTVEVVPSLPVWIPVNTLKYLPDRVSLIKLLSHIQNTVDPLRRNTIIEKFNNTKVSCRTTFMLYLNSAEPSECPCTTFLRELKMFPGRDSPTSPPKMFSVNDGLRFTTCNNFPIRYPQPLLDGFNGERKLLLALCAEEITFAELILLTLQDIKKSEYSINKVNSFMDFLVQNYHEIKTDRKQLDSIISLAREIPFIKCGKHFKKPSDLFCPSDEVLQDLFIAESMFPESKTQVKSVKVLSILGLKSRKDLSMQNLATTAHRLDAWSRSNKKSPDMYKKAQGLMKMLKQHPEFLEQNYDGKPLKILLSNLQCVDFEKDRIHSFPKWLPWFSCAHGLCKPSQAKDVTVANLVGSVMNVVKSESNAVCEAFCWKTNIPEDHLLLQLKKFRESYQPRYEADLLAFLRSLYEWLRNYVFTLDKWKDIPMIYVRGQFYVPEDVILEKDANDLKLAPYFHYIADTFKDLSDLFLRVGCQRKQSIDVLLITLTKIIRMQTIRKTNLSLAVSIIQRLAERKDELSTLQREHIPLPIYTKDKVSFKPLVECTFTENPEDYQEEDDEDTDDKMDSFAKLHFVSKVITEDIAKSLGVKTLQRRNFMYTEELTFEECGQEEELTTRLSRLIDEGYRDGLSVPKELLQNADDAGAKHIKFLYDERENLNAQESLLDKGMKTCQGPALWVYNDAKFTNEDFVNIRKLNGATKENNVRTIGKFGLGFCSVYNLTDVPSFVSCTSIVILDPHKSHLGDVLPGSSPGLKIDLSLRGNRRLLKRNKDQFKPYFEVFGCDLFCKEPYFNGTLFRLPFRTQEEAQTSKIRSEPYSKNDVSELLRLFISNAGNLLLFTQNVQSIEVYHLPQFAKSVSEQTLVFGVTRDCLQWNRNSFNLTSDSILSQLASTSVNISEIQKISIQLDVCQSAKGIKPNLKLSPTSTSCDWIISWATGTRESKTLASKVKSAIPLAAVAVPCDETSGFPKKLSQVGTGFFKEGKLYCFLPIPASTEQPWHLHGCFEVTSDRRQLRIDTEQDKSSRRNNWNELLMSDAALNAFIKLLIHFTEIPQTGSYPFHRLWPVKPSMAIKPFINSFFRYIVREDVRIFKGDISFHSFNEIMVLDTNIKNNRDVGKIAYDMLKTFPSRPYCFIVDMPKHVVESLKVNNDKGTNDQIQEKIIGATELLMVFLKNIDKSYWDSRIEERNKLLLYALGVDNKEIEEMIRKTKCIPCEHSQTLKSPNELIHPFADVTSMFSSTDGVFPINVEHFRNPQVLRKLVKLGMVETFIPIDRLQERCKSVERLSAECCSCALARIKSILTYLSRESVLSKYRTDEVRILRDIYWLPVMSKPQNWHFAWFSDSSRELKKLEEIGCHKHKETDLILGKPKQLHRQQDQDYLASVASLVDEKVVPMVSGKVWEMLGIARVATQQHYKKVVEQLCVISEEYNDNTKRLFSFFNDIYHKIVRNIKESIVTETSLRPERLLYLEPLCHKAVVLISDDKLVSPHRVAINVHEDCYPYLCRLPVAERPFKEFYSAIGVRDQFAVTDVVDAVQDNRGEKSKVSNKEVVTIIKLLRNLVEAMKFEGNTYDFYGEFHDYITGPDRHGNLYPTHELVMEDETFTTLVDMKLMHGEFSVSLGEQLGMKSKRQKCLEEISFAIPCGQKEELVTRLKGLLQDYPCDLGIMKELLQNSDDANSKELHFIKDYRTHSTNKTFGADHLQGPALCVYNDSYFTEDDLRGIQNLGVGSKQSDPSKTGQYGVGFNAVYHLTDTPSFLSKGPGLGDCGLLCILDPLCINIPVNESNPGLRCPADKVKENFPDALLGYLEKDGFFQSGKGTMFRFPLRHNVSDISSEIITKEKMDTLLDGFIDEMLNVLLFVKSVKTIKVSNISCSKLIHEYTLSVSISSEEEAKRDKFFNQVKEVANRNKDDLSRNLEIENFEVAYTLQLEDSRGHKPKWLVVQRFGCSKDVFVDPVIIYAFKDNQLGHLPLGGIAVPYPDFEDFSHKGSDSSASDQHTGYMKSTSLERVANIGRSFSQRASHYLVNAVTQSSETTIRHAVNSKKNSGQLFTFLPLPVWTGFQVHINGHFSLDHSRRDLWNEGYRKVWNEMLGSTAIAPCWIRAIEYFQQYFSSQKLCEMNVTSWGVINKMMERYHSLFPRLENLDHSYSKDIVKDFYNLIFTKESELFPIVKQDCQNFSVSWVALTSGSKMFGAVFNNICSHLRSAENDTEYGDCRVKSFILEGVLKDIGMDLIKSPMSIHETIEMLHCPTVPTATPSFVLRFLKSFESDQPGACSIGEVETSLERTKFESIDRLRDIVLYISKATEFPSEAQGLPVLLTEDNILHQLCTGLGLYHSPYSSLLPASKSVFVHDEFLQLLYHEELFNRGLLKQLDVEDLHEMIQREDLTEFRSGSIVLWNKEDMKKLITPEWIDRFFQFITENAAQDIENETQTFRESLVLFGNFSFLPAIYGPQQYRLIPISMAYCLFHNRGEDLGILKVINKMRLPFLDSKVFSEYNVKIVLRSFLAHTGNPGQLLRCLSHHKENIVQTVLTFEEAETVMSYFDSHVNELQSQSCVQNLRSLPLYCTHQETLVTIETGDILVLPGRIPVDGLQEWAIAANKIILRHTGRLSNLYKYLGLPCADVVEFYAETLVLTINLLPQQYWITHIQFMKQMLLNTFNSITTHHEQLLRRLKLLPFIEVDNRMKRPSELYWPENKVFSYMLTETDFPQIELRTDDWKQFFMLLGMNFEVTDEMLLQFAREIEIQGREHVSNDTRKKSEVLLSCFLKQTWNDVTCVRIKSTKFINPFRVGKQLIDVYQQPDSASRLICFEDSIQANRANLCWTSMDLLKRIPHEKHTRKLLRICTHPPVERVILHCQNVCTSFQEKLQLGTVCQELVKNTMNQFYLFFQNAFDNNTQSFRRLDQFPVIYLPLHNNMVQARAVITELEIVKEIKPYLYRAPYHYGQYFDVFVKMGAKEKIELNHCVYVLQQLKTKVNSKPLLPEEMFIAKQALLSLLFVLQDNISSKAGDGRLYLPNRERVLVDCKQLTVSDNEFYEYKLENKATIDYFVGFDMLGIKNVDPAVIFKRLPEALQPAILSNCVRSRVRLDETQELEDSARAIKLENFLHSDELISGILRLVKHNMSLQMQEFDEDRHVSKITNNIRATRVACVSNLNSVLVYNEQEILGTDYSQDWFIEAKHVTSSDHESYVFYISESVGEGNCPTDFEWVLCLIDGLTDLMQKCALHHQLSRESGLFVLFRKFERKWEISYELDKLRINPLYIPQTFKKSLFPKPGTYVEEHFHPFLEQGISPFCEEEYDFVAMELEDTSLTTDTENEIEPVYIYVRIKREVSDLSVYSDLRRIYLVDTGNLNSTYERIPIYRLYRFVRKREDTGTAIVSFDSEPVTTIPFDETCRRVREMLQEAWELPDRERRRIIKRLRMKWHPDRNPENEVYCSRIFNYISSSILLLERGKQVASVINERTGREAPDMSESVFHHLVLNVDRQATVYIRAFRDNIEDYSRSTHTGRYSHNASNPAPRPDIPEANRWIRQAKNDFRAASSYMSAAKDVEGYNWICYTCHQACEKALRAAHFTKDANNVPGKNHSLRVIVSRLGQDLGNQVREVEGRMSDYNRMRYPDSVSRPDIPSDLYSEDDAKFALEKTKGIIDKVEECFM